MKSCFQILRGAQRIDPDTAILIPGDAEAALEKERMVQGIPLEEKTLEILRGLSEGRYDYEIPKI